MSCTVPPLLRTLSLVAALSFSTASAQVLVTYAENPGAVNTSLQNTSVYTFNGLSANGEHDNVSWTGVGTFDHLYILAPNQYGGAADAANPYGSNYSVQSASLGGGAVPTTTLTLDSQHAYFGFWWSAGDATNLISFYNGSNLVARYDTSTLLDVLASQSAYKGNPLDRSENASQSYAFVNFLGMDGTTWDKVVLTNNGTSGFESDNYTDRLAPWTQATDGNIPGIQVATVSGTTVTPVVPEVSSCLMVAASGVLAAFRRRRAVV
jgi:hypothetical protein